MARLNVHLFNVIFVAQDSRPWASIKKGVGLSLLATSWALVLIMVGICFVLPLLFVVWLGVKVSRKLRQKPLPAAPAF